jgi:hypothetical protein
MMFIMACTYSSDYDHKHDYRDTIEITNYSEHNITRVVVKDTRTGEVFEYNKDDELIAKNGGSKRFGIDGTLDFIVCVEAENISEPFCTAFIRVGARPGTDSSIIFIAWNGPDNPVWVPVTTLPDCPKVFQQCN